MKQEMVLLIGMMIIFIPHVVLLYLSYEKKMTIPRFVGILFIMDGVLLLMNKIAEYIGII